MTSSQSPKIMKLTDSLIDKQALFGLSKKLETVFKETTRREKLGENIVSQFESIYLPLAAWAAEKHSDHPIVVGINGAQGSGKSTLSKILKTLLMHGFDKSVVILSIDDLYLSKERRNELARGVHNLLAVRGVPGTHDVELGIRLLIALVNNQLDEKILMPVFDKAKDDLLPKAEWEIVSHPVDIILFEKWRTYVNQQLKGSYQELFKFIDHLIMLEVPDMASVYEWRKLQEKKLRENCKENGIDTPNVMTETEIERFIMHYERITRHNLNEMPERADVLLKLDKDHQIKEVRVM